MDGERAEQCNACFSITHPAPHELREIELHEIPAIRTVHHIVRQLQRSRSQMRDGSSGSLRLVS
jgi:hypothetical protein